MKLIRSIGVAVGPLDLDRGKRLDATVTGVRVFQAHVPMVSSEKMTRGKLVHFLPVET